MQRARSTVSTIDGSSFRVPPRYSFQRFLGSGSYGTVASFHDNGRGRDVAIKRVARVFDNFLVLRRTLREVRLMRHFRHPNLLRLHKVLQTERGGSGDEVSNPCGNEIYLALELMDTDLDRLIHGQGRRSGITEDQARSFTAQMLLGLLHLHTGHVIHRDLKPANVFVRHDGDQVKIGDFGLSRGIAVDDDTGEAIHPGDEMLTEYVVTRWYRAPEVLLARSKYGPPVDVWSVGCILYEMWCRKALFPGKNSYDQLRRIFMLLGAPPSSELSWVPQTSMPLLDKAAMGAPTGEVASCWQKLITPPQKVHEDGLDLLQKMCSFNPFARSSVEAALDHPYLSRLISERDLRIAKAIEPVDMAYDRLYDGLGKEGETAALGQLSRLLRKESSSAAPVGSATARGTCLEGVASTQEGPSQQQPTAPQQQRSHEKPCLQGTGDYSSYAGGSQTARRGGSLRDAARDTSSRAGKAPQAGEGELLSSTSRSARSGLGFLTGPTSMSARAPSRETSKVVEGIQTLSSLEQLKEHLKEQFTFSSAAKGLHTQLPETSMKPSRSWEPPAATAALQEHRREQRQQEQQQHQQQTQKEVQADHRIEDEGGSVTAPSWRMLAADHRHKSSDMNQACASATTVAAPLRRRNLIDASGSLSAKVNAASITADSNGSRHHHHRHHHSSSSREAEPAKDEEAYEEEPVEGDIATGGIEGGAATTDRWLGRFRDRYSNRHVQPGQAPHHRGVGAGTAASLYAKPGPSQPPAAQQTDKENDGTSAPSAEMPWEKDVAATLPPAPAPASRRTADGSFGRSGPAQSARATIHGAGGNGGVAIGLGALSGTLSARLDRSRRNDVPYEIGQHVAPAQVSSLAAAAVAAATRASIEECHSAASTMSAAGQDAHHGKPGGMSMTRLGKSGLALPGLAGSGKSMSSLDHGFADQQSPEPPQQRKPPLAVVDASSSGARAKPLTASSRSKDILGSSKLSSTASAHSAWAWLEARRGNSVRSSAGRSGSLVNNDQRGSIDEADQHAAAPRRNPSSFIQAVVDNAERAAGKIQSSQRSRLRAPGAGISVRTSGENADLPRSPDELEFAVPEPQPLVHEPRPALVSEVGMKLRQQSGGLQFHPSRSAREANSLSRAAVAMPHGQMSFYHLRSARDPLRDATMQPLIVGATSWL